VNLLACLAIGGLYAAGMYMLVRRSFVKLVIGLVLLGHATNLLIFTAAGLTKNGPPLIPADKAERQAFYERVDLNIAGGELPITDPIPPALILTAIVISFAIVSFTIVLVKRAYQQLGTDDLAQVTMSDRM